MSTQKQPLTGKTALITGGSRGLGRAMVERFARDGAEVLFTYRSQEAAAKEVVQAVTAAGGSATALKAELGALDGVRALFTQIDEKFGGGACLDILVANAGVLNQAKLPDVDEAAFDHVFDINVKGVFFTIKAAVERMRDGGRVVTLGSGLTRFVMTEYIAYSASKSAVFGFTKILAQELGPRGITVNMLAPGAIETDMNPWLKSTDGAAKMRSMTALDRIGQAGDIADVAAFLASDDSRWVTGQRIEASGGQQL